MNKICISFKQTELELLNYLKSKRSPSNYIKDLIESDMKNSSKTKKSEKPSNDGFIW